MRILITGACGFVGSTLARTWLDAGGHQLTGIDNLIRAGSEHNRRDLARLGMKILHRDIRHASDFESLPEVDWVVDAAANPSVLAGVDGHTSSRQLVEHNLLGTLNIFEYCRRTKAGLVLLSTSRVYSIDALGQVRLRTKDGAFTPEADQQVPGLSVNGVSESFSTRPPVSLYGATKLASEQLALEYGAAYGFPVWINRCGVLAGAGQFCRRDQGIFSYWIHSWAARRPLTYTGFKGTGHQVRDCLHPRDLGLLVDVQMRSEGDADRIVNVSGGVASAVSLKQCSEWCQARFGARLVGSDAAERPFDVPWLVLDAANAHARWHWMPRTPREAIFDEIAAHAEAHPEWLEMTNG